MTYNPLELSDTSKQILDSIVSYHVKTLYENDAIIAHERSAKHRLEAASLARAFNQMISSGGVTDGPEAEFFQEAASLAGQRFDRNRLFIPFGSLAERDLTTNSAASIVATSNQAARDLLRPWSVTARAGIEMETGLVGNQTIPRTTVKVTPEWLSTEGTAATPSQPTFQQIALTPNNIIGVIPFSRQLALQSNAEAVVRRELTRTIGTGIDQAVIAGTGGKQPLGLTNTTGINTETGTSLAQAGVVSMKRKCADANASDDGMAFLGTTAVRELLEKRERATGSGFIWDNGRVASRPAFASTDIPTATLICGQWSEIYLGIWGSGFVVEIDPMTYFKQAIIQARLIVSCDIAVRTPAAFCVAASVS